MKYVEFGSGETILWIHGGNVAGWMWGAQVPAFENCHSIVPDLPGFGESRDEQWVSIAATADALAVLLDEPAHVVGLSLGASVGIELAVRHPERVRSLFLASAQVTPPRRRDKLAARALLLFWNQPGFWRSLARSYGLTGDDAELFIDTGLGIDRRTAVAIYEEVRMGIADATLQRLVVPTIAIAGEKDSPAISRASLDAISPRATVAIAPGMHHQWNIENVELFNSALRQWLTSGTAATGLGTRI